MLWSIILIPKNNNGWYINYIENKLINQINALKLEKEIEVVVLDENLQISGKYVSVVDNVEISSNFIELIYNKLKNCKKDYIGLKGVSYMDNVPLEVDLPISKLNPVRTDIILKIQNLNYYINSENLSNLVKTVDNLTVDNLNTPIIFYEDLKKQPFSIIVSAYKSQKYIEECLDSIENQTYFKDNDNYEILVGVDGCQDTLNKLQEIKHKYRNLHIYMMSENKGTYITCNTLIDLVKYENVIRFDSDDVMTPNMIKEVARNINDNDIMILGSLDLTNGVVGTKFLLTEGIIYFRKSMMDNIAGGYQPWICSADTELIKRLVNKVKITQLKKALFHRRLHSESLTQKEGTRYRSELREGYKKMIKPHYTDNEIKIERVVNNYVEIKHIDQKFKNLYKLTIIIPVYKNFDLLKNCLNSILTSTYDSFNLLIINDSPQEHIDFINEYNKEFYNTFKNSEVIFIKNDKNLGFIETVNKGINQVLGDVILLNSDTKVNFNWMERMIEYLKIYNVASITPLSNSASQCSFPIQHKNQSHYRDLNYKQIDKIFNRVPIENSHDAPTGVGFCFYMTRKAILKIGLFDNINFKIGYGEENDWCWRAVKSGFKNIIASNIYVSHEHGSSFSNINNLSKIRKDNYNVLLHKHPNFFNIVNDYNKEKKLDNIYLLLKFTLDYEYFRPIKNSKKIFFGKNNINIDSEYSEIYLNIENNNIKISFNDYLIYDEIFKLKNLKTLLYLLKPDYIEIEDDNYLKYDEISEYIKEYEKTKNKIIIEIPHHDNLSGGILRMEKLIFELPRYATCSGGIKESLKFLDKFPNGFLVSTRFQKLTNEIPTHLKNWTVGLPDSTFPECDVCITYSDNPYLSQLTKLPQVKKVMLYMLSYGMSIERERKNIMNDNVVVMCSTKKLENVISAEGVKVNRVGFALDMEDMYIESNIDRKKYLAIMYHNNCDKRYELAVNIANDLFERKKIDGVITFGTDVNYNSARKPIGLIKHYINANRNEIRTIFNTCQCFLMPSITEGLNLTPIESTLCGCPSVICDGAIDELFFDNKTCFISKIDDINELTEKTEKVIKNFDKYSKLFYQNMYKISQEYNWGSVIKKIIDLI